MSFHTMAHSPGIFVPEEVTMLKCVLEDMRGEPWFPRSPAKQEEFASFLIRGYERGIRCPEKLKAFCAVAVRLYFVEQDAPRA